MRPCLFVPMALLLAASLPAAANEPAAASEPAANAELVLTDRQTFLLPIDDAGNRAPEYPAAVLAQQQGGARAICMRVDIDTEGAVSYAGPIVRESDCPPITELTKQFVDASEAAMREWRFEPAVVCNFRSKRAKEAAGMSCQGGKEEPQSTTLTFRLLFDQVDGKGAVRMQR